MRKSLSPWFVTVLLASAAVVALGACGAGQDDDLARFVGHGQMPIVNGSTHQGHPAVGIVTAGGSLCTATLVGKYTVITAAHCVTPGRPHYFVVNNRFWPATSATRHPQYDPNYANNDVAVVVLRDAPPVTPAAISTKPPRVGQELTLVGFGVTSTDGQDSGVKRSGTNTVAYLAPTRIVMSGASGTRSNLCFGDSGGPTFAEIDGREVQVGIHSTIAGECGVQGHDMRVDVFADWLRQGAGGDLSEDGKISPKLDEEPPRVTIVSPDDGAKLPFRVAVTARVEDNEAAGGAELLVDGQPQAELAGAGPEFAFAKIELAEGEHRLTVVGMDVAGNRAEQSVTVTVAAPVPFGQLCGSNDACDSGLCVGHPTAGKYCTQLCDRATDPCPDEAACLPASGGQHACAPPASLLSASANANDVSNKPGAGPEDGNATTTSSVEDSGGGCALAGRSASSSSPARGRASLPLLLLLLGLLHTARRRR